MSCGRGLSGGFVALVIASLVGCFGPKYDPEQGAGGNAMLIEIGGAPSTSNTSSSATSAGGSTSDGAGGAASSTGVTSTSTGGPMPCDTGVVAPSDSITCQTCADCAVATDCAAQQADYKNAPGSATWHECVFGANPCPSDNPSTQNDEFIDCVNVCEQASPGIFQKFLAVIGCAVCETCVMNCDAATTCGG